jgi:hypothetical protein
VNSSRCGKAPAAPISRRTREREALERALAQPVGGKGNGLAPSEALKHRAELVRLIERAERDWLAAKEAIERQSSLRDLRGKER